MITVIVGAVRKRPLSTTCAPPLGFPGFLDTPQGKLRTWSRCCSRWGGDGSDRREVPRNWWFQATLRSHPAISGTLDAVSAWKRRGPRHPAFSSVVGVRAAQSRTLVDGFGRDKRKWSACTLFSSLRQRSEVIAAKREGSPGSGRSRSTGTRFNGRTFRGGGGAGPGLVPTATPPDLRWGGATEP